MASGAATAPGAMLTDWGFLGRFIALSSKDLLTCSQSTGLARLENGRNTACALNFACVLNLLDCKTAAAATAGQEPLYRKDSRISHTRCSLQVLSALMC